MVHSMAIIKRVYFCTFSFFTHGTNANRHAVLTYVLHAQFFTSCRCVVNFLLEGYPRRKKLLFGFVTAFVVVAVVVGITLIVLNTTVQPSTSNTGNVYKLMYCVILRTVMFLCDIVSIDTLCTQENFLSHKKS